MLGLEGRQVAVRRDQQDIEALPPQLLTELLRRRHNSAIARHRSFCRAKGLQYVPLRSFSNRIKRASPAAGGVRGTHGHMNVHGFLRSCITLFKLRPPLILPIACLYAVQNSLDSCKLWVPMQGIMGLQERTRSPRTCPRLYVDRRRYLMARLLSITVVMTASLAKTKATIDLALQHG